MDHHADVDDPVGFACSTEGLLREVLFDVDTEPAETRYACLPVPDAGRGRADLELPFEDRLFLRGEFTHRQNFSCQTGGGTAGDRCVGRFA